MNEEGFCDPADDIYHVDICAKWTPVLCTSIFFKEDIAFWFKSYESSFSKGHLSIYQHQLK